MDAQTREGKCIFYMQHPQRAQMAHDAVCRLYTLMDSTGAPQRVQMAHTTIHMEQQPQRARMRALRSVGSTPSRMAQEHPQQRLLTYYTIGME